MKNLKYVIYFHLILFNHCLILLCIYVNRISNYNASIYLNFFFLFLFKGFPKRNRKNKNGIQHLIWFYRWMMTMFFFFFLKLFFFYLNCFNWWSNCPFASINRHFKPFIYTLFLNIWAFNKKPQPKTFNFSI